MTAQVLDHTLALLGPNGEHWIKGQSNDGNGGRCLATALWDAGVAERYDSVEGYIAATDAHNELNKVVRRVIHEQYGAYSIPAFNDSPLTTFADVVAVVEKVRAEL